MTACHPVKLRGFSLIEILVAISITSISLVALSQLYTYSMWMYERGRNTSIASQRAQYELEKIQNLQFNILKNSAHLIDDSRYSALEGYSELPTNNGVQFPLPELRGGRGTITISNFRDYEHILQIVIEITWQSPQRTITPVRVVTLMTQ